MLDGPTIDPRALRHAFGSFATGVTVVTMLDGDGKPTGVTVNSFSSLSLEPPLCLFSLGKEQVSCKWINPDCRFIINVLAADQEAIAWQFAKPAEDKFAGIAHGMGECGVPYIVGAIARFECRHWATHEGGDHDIIVGEITAFAEMSGDAMLFHKGQFASLPVAPKA